MPRKKPAKPEKIDPDLRTDWNKHIDSVRETIKKLDRKRMEAVVRARTIAVTN